MRCAWAATANAVALVLVDRFTSASDPAGHSVIDGEDGHHLQRVRRLGVDEPVVIADGWGQWYLTRIATVGDGTLTVARVGETCVEPEPRPALTIAFAPAKRDHGAEVAHQLVELGVDRIIPLITHHGVVRWDGARADKSIARLRRVIRDAARQCHRARLPVIDAPTPITALSAERGLLVAGRDGVSVDELDGGDTDRWCVVIGPEGGLTIDELATLESATHLGVGPHVLRSVTAPVAVAAALVSLRRC